MNTPNHRARDAKQVPLSQVDKLRQDAESAAQVRALTTHPDVVALRVERVRAQVDALIWVGITLGLAFTMVNVQTFAAAGAALFSLAWLAAWVLDPMVSLVLVAVLRAEQVTARYQVETGVWVRCTKVFAFAATYVMNTWTSWQRLDPAGIVLHSVPPVLVYCAAEAGPILRDRLTEAVLRAAEMATLTTTTAAADTAMPVPATAPGPVGPTPPAFAARAVDPTADTIELPVIRPDRPAPVPSGRAPRPAPTAPTRAKSARSGKPAARRSKARKPPARSMADLRSELETAIAAGEVDPEPTAEQIRKALRIAPDRARALRDEQRDGPRTAPATPVDITTTPPGHAEIPTSTATTHNTETAEVTRDAA